MLKDWSRYCLQWNTSTKNLADPTKSKRYHAHRTPVHSTPVHSKTTSLINSTISSTESREAIQSIGTRWWRLDLMSFSIMWWRSLVEDRGCADNLMVDTVNFDRRSRVAVNCHSFWLDDWTHTLFAITFAKPAWERICKVWLTFAYPLQWLCYMRREGMVGD